MNFFLDSREISTLKRLSFRQIISQTVVAAYSVMSTYILWKCICFLLNNDSPIVCVLSESMEPGFRRGDILFLTPKRYHCGDIMVYQVYENTIPIVHRIITKDGNKYLTKGDNNRYNDIGLYKPGRKHLLYEETRAGVFGFIPFLGFPTIWINQIPGLKQMIIALGAASVFLTRS